MNKIKKIIFAFILVFLLIGCTTSVTPLEITNGDKLVLEVGESVDLDFSKTEEVEGTPIWTSSNTSAVVDEEGIVTARVEGKVIITVTIGSYKDTIEIEVLPSERVEIKVSLEIENSKILVGETTRLIPVVKPVEYENLVEYIITSGSECISIEGNEVTALKAGAVVINAKVDIYNSSSILLEIEEPEQEEEEEFFEDPYVNVNKNEFYQNYVPATSYLDSVYRTEHGLMSGSIAPQDQAPTISENRPMENGLYVKNTSMLFSSDGNTYYVLNYKGEIVNKIYKGAAYVVLEEVAAYVFAFGDIPANHSSSKKTKPTSSVWGEYLRVNHTQFSGSTTKYPYEPALPNISGVGGEFQYYEMDIGTTGTDCDPSYPVVEYNNGTSIERGAARIVYARCDRNGNMIIDPYEKYVFYTYNHYNDFQEYLNYEGGWGEMFGNITGGGTLSSKYDYNPTPYVPVVHKEFGAKKMTVSYKQFYSEYIYVYIPLEDKKYYYC